MSLNINIFTILILSSLFGLTACTSHKTPQTTYHINKELNLNRIERSFQLYTKHKSHKAMAVAIDSIGKYVIGFSFDCASLESAKRIALENCTKANKNAEVPADATCLIYALENNVIFASQR